MIESNKKWLTGLHFLLALALPLILFSLLSCVRAKEEKEELGPEVDPIAVKTVLDEVFSNNTYVNGQAGQYVYYEENISAQGGMAQDGGFDFVKVLERTEPVDEPDKIRFRMHYIRKKLNDEGKFETIETEESYNVRKTPEPSFAALLTDLKFVGAASGIKASARPNKPTKITYHHLEVQRGNVAPVPEAVSQRPGCGGLANCKMNQIFIRLDEVRWYGENDYDKMHYDLMYSKDTPHLINIQNDTMGGLLVMGCLSTLIPYEGKRVYIKDCVSLKDFQK